MRELWDILWVVIPLAALACFAFCAVRMFRAGRAGRFGCCCGPGTGGSDRPGGVSGR